VEHFRTVWGFWGSNRLVLSSLLGPCIALDSALLHSRKLCAFALLDQRIWTKGVNHSVMHLISSFLFCFSANSLVV